MTDVLFWAAVATLAAWCAGEAYVRRRRATAHGLMLAPLAVTLGSALLPVVLGGMRQGASMSAQLVVAVVGALPGILDAIGKSALLAFLTGGVLCGAGGMMWRSDYTAGLERRARDAMADARRVRASAIAEANGRADAAIAAAIAEANRRADAAIAARLSEIKPPAAKSKK